MGPIIVYNTELSPPGRAVWMTAAALGLKWTHKEVDIFNKAQYAPEFLKAPMIFFSEKTITPRILEELEVMYGFVNDFLEGNKWICGEDLTIGDFGLLATMSSLTAVFPVDSKKHPNIMPWIKRAERTLPYFNKVNAQGNKMFQEKMTPLLKKFE